MSTLDDCQESSCRSHQRHKKEGRLGDVTKILGVSELLGDFVALIFADDEKM